MSRGLIKLAGATALASLAVAGCAGLVDTVAQTRTRAAVARLIADRPGLTIADASVGLFDGFVRRRGVAFDAPSLSLRIGTLRVRQGADAAADLLALIVTPARAFPQVGDGGQAAAPGVVTAENVSIAYQGVTYAIPKIEVAGTTLTQADLAAMLDVNSAETIEARLRRLTAASVSVPEIKADTVEGDFEQHWDQQQVLFAGVKDGVAAAGSAGPGILKTKSAKGTSVAETGGLQMTGIDMGQIVHVATVARTDAAEPQQLLAQSLVVSAIKLHDEEQGPTITLASLKEAGLKARSLALISQARSLLLATGKPGDPAVDAFVDDIANSVSVDLLQADDLVMMPPKAANEGPVRVTRLTVTGVANRRIGSATLQGLRYEQGANRVALAGVDMHDVTLPKTLDGRSVPGIGDLTLSKMDVDVDTAEEGKPEKRLAFEFGRAALSSAAAATGTLPAKSAMEIDDLRIAIRPDMSPMLIALGYPKLELSSHLTTSYDGKTQRLAIDDWTLNGVGMGKAVLKLQLGKVTDAILSTDADAQKAATEAVVFKGVDLTLNDAGLVGRLLTYRATADGVTVTQERESAIDLVRNKLPVLAGDPAKLKPVEEAVARFIADPKQPLHLSVSSADGLGAADAGLLNDPNALLDKLAITATTGP